MSTDYEPTPLDLANAELPEPLGPVIEQLGKHLHNVWAQERLKDGWVLGPERSDKLKEHPFLIPYEDLPERERDYDRNMAIHTLKYIINSGYQIIAPAQSIDGKAWYTARLSMWFSGATLLSLSPLVLSISS